MTHFRWKVNQLISLFYLLYTLKMSEKLQEQKIVANVQINIIFLTVCILYKWRCSSSFLSLQSLAHSVCKENVQVRLSKQKPTPSSCKSPEAGLLHDDGVSLSFLWKCCCLSHLSNQCLALVVNKLSVLPHRGHRKLSFNRL